MNWLMENWYVLIAAAALVGAVIASVYNFRGQPSETQIAKVKEWLIWACVEAERALQSGTGQLKLREVWNLFCAVPAFTWVARVISFETFSGWVSESLIQVKEMIVANDSLAKYVYGDNKDQEVAKLKEQLGE
ncbi:MAG: hypothetical protein IJP31_04525 [Lachnospiraceae bacterium]|nr:hypothetical protein [Lachnospiraceae bacterium]